MPTVPARALRALVAAWLFLVACSAMRHAPGKAPTGSTRPHPSNAPPSSRPAAAEGSLEEALPAEIAGTEMERTIGLLADYPDAGPDALTAAVLAAAEHEYDARRLGGRSILLADHRSFSAYSFSAYMYASGDVLFTVLAPEDQAAAIVLSALA